MTCCNSSTSKSNSRTRRKRNRHDQHLFFETKPEHRVDAVPARQLHGFQLQHLGAGICAGSRGTRARACHAKRGDISGDLWLFCVDERNAGKPTRRYNYHIARRENPCFEVEQCVEGPQRGLFTDAADNRAFLAFLADQSNSLQGQISVTVAESYPNGTMLVQGQKLTSLNRGDEHTQFSGLIRAIDVSSDNTIPSTKVANARIVYGGTGEIASASKQGWLQKFFSFISPF